MNYAAMFYIYFPAKVLDLKIIYAGYFPRLCLEDPYQLNTSGDG